MHIEVNGISSGIGFSYLAMGQPKKVSKAQGFIISGFLGSYL